MWRWETDPASAEDRSADVEFEDQAAAEAWLTEHYPDLQDRGVRQVTLWEGDRIVYGPMSLDPA